MSELFRPISTKQLANWLFTELDSRDSAFGIPREHFFVPDANDRFRTKAFGQPLDTPFGPAAGPHSQMAQNIIAAWLCGARYIELKTVQTLDVLSVSKPCIDMQDEGYNVEWSQELKVYESFEEYLRAWVLIHALHHKLRFAGDSPAIVFNMSVGYDLDGIKKPNMQWFLSQMRDCSGYKCRIVEQVVEKAESAAASRGSLQSTTTMLQKAEIPLRAGEAMAVQVGIILLAMAIGFLLTGSPVGAVLFAIPGAILPSSYVKFRVKRRKSSKIR